LAVHPELDDVAAVIPASLEAVDARPLLVELLFRLRPTDRLFSVEIHLPVVVAALAGAQPILAVPASHPPQLARREGRELVVVDRYRAAPGKDEAGRRRRQ